MMLNMDYFLEELWEHLALMRVFTKRQGHKPDFDDPLILRGGCTIEHVVNINLLFRPCTVIEGFPFVCI